MSKKKTKEEILKHLLERGYWREEMDKIMAYLVGSGYKKIGEPVSCKNGIHTFREFVEWIEKEPQGEMCKEIAAGLDYFLSHIKTSETIKEKTWNQITWLTKNNDFISKCIENKDKIERYLKSTEPLQQDTADRINMILEALNYDLKNTLESMKESGKHYYPNLFKK